MELGLCLAAFGDLDLATALAHTDKFGPLWLDVPTDSTFGLVDGARCATDARYRAEVAQALAGRQIGCVSNSRDAQLLLGPHDRHTDPVCAGDAGRKRAHALTCS